MFSRFAYSALNDGQCSPIFGPVLHDLLDFDRCVQFLKLEKKLVSYISP